MGSKIACSMPGCRADVAGKDQRMSEETRKSLIAKFSPRADTRQGQENSVIQRTTEHVETNHGEERKEGEEEASVNQIETSQTKEENSLPNTYPQGEENYHISDLEPDKEPDNCDVESEDFWDECYALISEKKEDADEILSVHQVEETLPEGSAKSFEEDVVELNERYALIPEKEDDADEIQSENLVEETLPEGPTKSSKEDVVELNEGLTWGKKDDQDEILSDKLVEETFPEDSAKGSEEDFVELNEVPDEFIGAWCLIEKDHTENLDEFLKANDIAWALRKVAIKFIGNTFTISMDKIDGGLEFMCLDPPSDPKDYVWTYKFGEETKNVENKKKEFTCTIDVKDGIIYQTECPANPKYQKNVKMYITPEGILIRETETGGVVMTRRMMKMEEV